MLSIDLIYPSNDPLSNLSCLSIWSILFGLSIRYLSILIISLTCLLIILSAYLSYLIIYLSILSISIILSTLSIYFIYLLYLSTLSTLFIYVIYFISRSILLPDPFPIWRSDGAVMNARGEPGATDDEADDVSEGV